MCLAGRLNFSLTCTCAKAGILIIDTFRRCCRPLSHSTPHHHPLNHAFIPIIASLSMMTGNMITISKNHTTNPATQSAVVPDLNPPGGRGKGFKSSPPSPRPARVRGTGGSGFSRCGGSGVWTPRRWESEGAAVVSFGAVSAFGGTGGGS